MNENGLTLVKKPKRKTIHKLIIGLVVAAVLGLGIYFGITECSVTNIEIRGNHTYSDAEIIREMKKQDYVPNTLVMLAQNRIFKQTYLPFIENVTMSFKNPHVLRIRVKEKLRPGVLEYMNKNVYFYSEGSVVESRNQRFEGVPLVTGLNLKEMVLGKKLKVSQKQLNTIVSITKKIATYKLDISEIRFDGEDDITLISGDYEIYLGDSDCLDGKMSKIPQLLEAVAKEGKKGVIDMHLYTDEKNIITYRK